MTPSVLFGGLRIEYDDRVLRPRPWTLAQSRWAASLLDRLPEGPVLEICSGAGQIGLAAVAGTARHLVCVDVDPVACDFARANAGAAGMADRVQVRLGAMGSVLEPHERFALVIADPPWVRTDAVGRFPQDPVRAIDGGGSGLDLARQCVDVVRAHLAPGGRALLQLGGAGQAEEVRSWLVPADRLALTRVESYGDRGVVALLERPLNAG